MQITNNLNNDISAAPEWFNQAKNIKPSDKILESDGPRRTPGQNDFSSEA